MSSTVAKVRETFCVSFVLIRFVIGELLSEVGGRVGHGLVLAWFESYVLRLVFLDSSLQLPGQEKGMWSFHLDVYMVCVCVCVCVFKCVMRKPKLKWDTATCTCTCS